MSDQRDGGITWTEETWNPIRGCSRVSEGCRHCYAETMAARFSGPGQPYEGLARSTPSGPRWTGKVRLVEEHLADPLRWKRPRRIFVNSMSDLFHEALSNEQIAAIFGVMAAAPQHTFQVLTKRAKRMREWFAWAEAQVNSARVMCVQAAEAKLGRRVFGLGAAWPLPSVWLGVSVEDQATADERIPDLLETPAAVRWVSYEPALGPVDLGPWLGEQGYESNSPAGWVPKEAHLDWIGPTDAHLDWIVIGGESGPGARARPFDVAWARATIAACKAAGVKVFVKQLGAYVVDRNDAGFEAENEVWAEGPEEGQPTEPGAWPTPVDVEHDLDGYVDGYQGAPVRVRLRDRKGGDPAEWPVDLRVREWPSAEGAR